MKLKKIFTTILAIAIIAAGSVYYYAFIYSKNRKFDMEGADAISVDASALVKSYQENEANANKLYLDKVLLIKGAVSNTANNQTGERTLTLSSEDPFAGVMATLDSTEISNVHVGDTLQVKGFCKGFLSDVVITNAIIIK